MGGVWCRHWIGRLVRDSLCGQVATSETCLRIQGSAYLAWGVVAQEAMALENGNLRKLAAEKAEIEEKIELSRKQGVSSFKGVLILSFQKRIISFQRKIDINI